MTVFGTHLHAVYAASTLLALFVVASGAVAVCTLNAIRRHGGRGWKGLLGLAGLVLLVLLCHADIGRRWDTDAATLHLRGHTRRLLRLGGLMVGGYLLYGLWRLPTPTPDATR